MVDGRALCRYVRHCLSHKNSADLKDLSDDAKRSLAEEFGNEANFSDGYIFAEICSYPTNSLDANRWRSRLTTHKNEILRRLLKHPTLSPALRRTMQIPGLRRGLQLGVWSKVLADKYEEVRLQDMC